MASTGGNGPGGPPGLAGGSLLAFLQSELLVLSNEARRKHSDIKDALDKVFNWLRELKEMPGQIDIAAELGRSHDLLVPLLLSSRTGNPKMLSIAVSCLHRLITYNALSSDKDTAEVVFGVLSEAVSGPDDVQVKALQCIMPLLANSVSSIHGSQLVQAYLIGFRLHESSSPMVNNAAVAIVRQLVIWLFEQVGEEDSHVEEGGEHPYAADALVIFQDVCLLLNEEKPLVLQLKGIDKSFALELVESVLANHSRIFRQHPEYVRIVREKICTMAVRKFTEGAAFPQSSRLWRVVSILLRDFHDLLPLESEIFLSFAPRILEDPGKADWDRALVLEALKDVFGEHWLMLELYELCDRRQDGQVVGPKVFQDILVSLCSLTVRECEGASERGLEVDYTLADIKVGLLGQYDKAAAPSVPKLYSLHLAFDSLSHWIHGMLSVSLDPQGFEEKVIAMNANCKELLERVWKHLLNALFCLFSTDLQAEWRRLLFCALEELGKLLCKYRLSSQLTALLEHVFGLESHLHLQAWQTCLNIAIADPEMIGEEAWPILVQVLHSVDIYTGMKARKLSYSAAITTPVPLAALESPAKKGFHRKNPSQTELDKLTSLSGLAKALLDGSSDFTPRTFQAFTTALAERAVVTSSDMFVLAQFKQVALGNIQRFTCAPCPDETAWLVVHQNLLALLANDDAQIRTQAIEFLGRVCQAYYGSVDPAVFEANEALQARILDLLLATLMDERHRDVHHLAIDMLGRLIQSLGPHLLPGGWSKVFAFLEGFLGSRPDLSLLRAAFSCSKLITSDFLPYLDHSGVREALKLVRRFSSQPDDLNIALTAVGLVWDMSDYLRLAISKRHGKTRLKDVFALWIGSLELLLDATSEPRPELRNSAVQTLTRTVELFALIIKPEEWAVLFEKILLPLLEEINALDTLSPALTTAMPTHDTWDDTMVLILQGVVKIYTDFLQTISGFPPFPFFWASLMEALKRACQPSRSIEVVSVAVACLNHSVASLRTSESSAEVWRRTWRTWTEVSQFMPFSASFTQETLSTFVGIFAGLYEAQGDTEFDWLRACYDVFDASLRCSSPTDLVKDTEAPSPLQSVVVKQVCRIDYQRWGMEAKILAMQSIAGWMELAPELGELEMTRTTSVRRARHSVAPSRPRSPIRNGNIAGTTGEATFIGLSFTLLEVLGTFFTAWKDDTEFYPTAFMILIRATGRLMVLKYRAASSATGEPSWKLAQRAFKEIFAQTPKGYLDVTCWCCLVDILAKSLDASRRMVPVNLAVDQLLADEDLDMDFVKFIRTSVLPVMEMADQQTRVNLLRAVEESSHLYYLKKDSPRLTTIELPSNLGSPTPISSRVATPVTMSPIASASASSELIPVVKERLAITCLQALFDICSASAGLSPAIQQAALPILVARIKDILESYVTDRQLLGAMPFPRVRQDEMLFVLVASCQLRIKSGLAIQSLLPADDTFVVPEETIIDEQPVAPNASQPAPPLDLKRILVGTEIGHLFYLYPYLCATMEISDPDVAPLVQDLFNAMGASCGLL